MGVSLLFSDETNSTQSEQNNLKKPLNFLCQGTAPFDRNQFSLCGTFKKIWSFSKERIGKKRPRGGGDRGFGAISGADSRVARSQVQLFIQIRMYVQCTYRSPPRATRHYDLTSILCDSLPPRASCPTASPMRPLTNVVAK